MANEKLAEKIDEEWKKISFSRLLNHVKRTYKKEAVKEWFYYFMIQGTLDSDNKEEMLELFEEIKNIKK